MSSPSKRPVGVTMVAWVYIAVGAVGFSYHLNDLRGSGEIRELFLIEVVSLLAIVSGIFMLRAQNWARWVAVGWIALHVVISAFHPISEFLVHCVFFVVIAWLLLSRNSTSYFRRAAASPH